MNTVQLSKTIMKIYINQKMYSNTCTLYSVFSSSLVIGLHLPLDSGSRVKEFFRWRKFYPRVERKVLWYAIISAKEFQFSGKIFTYSSTHGLAIELSLPKWSPHNKIKILLSKLLFSTGIELVKPRTRVQLSDQAEGCDEMMPLLPRVHANWGYQPTRPALPAHG